MMASTSAPNLATSASGVAIGTMMAVQFSTASPAKPASAVVGTSGTSGWRALLAIARARSLPDCTWAMLSGRLLKIRSSWPPIRSVMLGAPPL